MDVDNRNHMDEDVQTICTEVTKETEVTLPTYRGDYESLSVINRVPSMRKPTMMAVASANLHTLLSIHVTCMLLLTD